MKSMLKQAISSLLRKYSFIHVEEFTKPYIIEKDVEGVKFLLHIRDRHARMWYDLYHTDPAWAEMRFIREHLVKPGDVVIECGSHHGCTTIMLSKWVGPRGKVYAYEPGAHNYEVLLENLALNHIENVQPVRAAVGSESGSVAFHEDRDQSMASRVDSAPDRGADRTAQYVPQVSLATHAAEAPALVKMDTQGYVYQPLLGLSDIIRAQRPNLALEIDGRKVIEEYGSNFDRIFELIKHEEYVYFVQFSETDAPEPIELSEVVPQWTKRNNLSNEIHLYAKRRAPS